MLYFGPTDVYQCFSIIVFDDGVPEGNEVFHLSVFIDAEVNYTLIGRNIVTFLITDEVGMFPCMHGSSSYSVLNCLNLCAHEINCTYV